MIDEKKLDALAEKVKYQILITHQPFETADLSELVSLARLGLWAEKHGVPAAAFYADKGEKTRAIKDMLVPLKTLRRIPGFKDFQT